MNVTSAYTNSARLVCEGQVDLSAAGAVSATRGDGIAVTKNGTGLYDIVIDNPGELRLVKVLSTRADMQDTAIGTTKDVNVNATVTQSATTGKFLMTIRTVDAAGAAVDEATDALTVSFGFVIQTARMTNPLD